MMKRKNLSSPPPFGGCHLSNSASHNHSRYQLNIISQGNSEAYMICDLWILPTIDFELRMTAAGVLCLVLVSLVQDGKQVGKVLDESLAQAD